MAIYHLSAKIVTRRDGRSVVAAAAYRSGESLDEESTGLTYDYTRKRGIEHTEILAPEGAPEWVCDRLRLWNAVEAAEKRKDAQLAREIEIGLPRELNADAQVALLRDFVQREYVSQGMIADLAVHRDNANNPHAHILLTLRRINAQGFGLKERSWNERSKLMAWRAGWEEVTNAHLVRAGLAVRIDHRSLKAQGLELMPGRKIGVSLERQQAGNLPNRIADRVAEQQHIARGNGERILADPGVALRALTHSQPTFIDHDIARFLHTRTDGAEQFRAAYLRVTTSAELVAVGPDDRGRQRYTIREMLEIEDGLLHRAELMAPATRQRVGAGQSMKSIEASQQRAAERWREKQHAREEGSIPDTGPLHSERADHRLDVTASSTASKNHDSRRGPEDELDV